ncbi:P-loop containing nucleoside triphosphate hydrolase protein [Scleroderma yunnanense]
MLVLTHHSSRETASGKSENHHLAIKSLLELSISNPGKKGSKLANQVLAAEFVIKTYRNAHTLFNPNASRFGKYTELQFTDHEQNSVVATPFGERNFHIFYHLIMGAPHKERQHLHLQEKVQYRYLGQHIAGAHPNSFRDGDAHSFKQLKVTLKIIGLSKNLKFTIDHSHDIDTAIIRNTDTLSLVADFLGVQPSTLKNEASVSDTLSLIVDFLGVQLSALKNEALVGDTLSLIADFLGVQPSTLENEASISTVSLVAT